MAPIDKKNEYRRDDSGFEWPSLTPNWENFQLNWRRWMGRVGVLLIIGIVIVLAWDFGRYTYGADRYQAELDVRNNEAVPAEKIREEILAGYDQDQLPSVLTLSVDRIQASLDEMSRLRDVSVHVEQPNHLIVTLEEREPVALIARASPDQEKPRFLPADPQGTLFKPLPKERSELPSQLPLIFGLERADTDSEEYGRKWERVLEVLEAVKTEFPVSIIESLEIRPGGFVEMNLLRPKELEVRLGLDQYVEKIQRLREFIETEAFQETEEWINLSDPDEVRVR